jgi:hypothetical protein
MFTGGTASSSPRAGTATRRRAACRSNGSTSA